MKQLISSMQNTKLQKAKPKKKSAKKAAPRPQTNSNGAMVPIGTSGAAVSDMFQRNTRSTIGKQLGMMPKMSKDGLAFLKAVFAAPDFAGQGEYSGIPDASAYSIVKYRHVAVSDLRSLFVASAAAFPITTGETTTPRPIPQPGQDILICQPPVPGIAFYWAAVAAGAAISAETDFVPVQYPEFKQLFNNNVQDRPFASGTSGLNDFISNFKFGGNSIELICMSNSFKWTGSITAFKARMTLADSGAYQAVSAQTPLYTKVVNGLESFNNIGSTSTYAAPANLGIYMTAVNAEAEFNTQPVTEDLYYANEGEYRTIGHLLGCLPGVGSLETNYIRLSGVVTGTAELPVWTEFTARSWSVLEYTPVSGTLLEKMAQPSAEYDPVALKVYRDIVRDLPVAVTYFENDSFWKKLLNLVGKVGSALTVLPGPYGAIAGSIGGLATGIGSAIN